jgi:pimeloyl-ACP methyl ester carboxylesterase
VTSGHPAGPRNPTADHVARPRSGYGAAAVGPKASPTSHSYFSQRLRLHYLDWGNDDAPPLLMLHGNRDHCHCWDWMAERLRDDYHVIAPDFRGHGDSQWAIGSTYVMSDYLYDIAQLVHQKGTEPVRIVAHSMGSMVAQRYAGTFPDQVTRLVAIEGYGRLGRWFDGDTPSARVRNWIDSIRVLSGRTPRRYATLEEAYERMLEANGRLTPEQARHLTIHGANQNEDGTYSWKFDNYVHARPMWEMSPEDTRELLRTIACPVLFIGGAESFAVSEDDAFLADFRDARLEIVQGAGHWPHHDQLDVVTDLVRDFLV